MKGGHTPIHIMRLAPADYVNDPFVRRMYQQRDYRTAAFYPVFLFYCHMEGGDLPATVADLAAVVLMPVRDVEAALSVCLAAGKIVEEGGRLFHKRVRREVLEELEYRRQQSDLGKKGGRPKKAHKEEGELKGRVLENKSPPAPPSAPAPSSTPAPSEARGEEERAGSVVPTAVPPAASSAALLPDHDPGRPLEAQVAERCLRLARRDVADQGREPTAAEVLAVLAAVSATPNGKAIDRIRGAPVVWLEQTLAICERFERENFDGGDEPPKGGG